MARLELRRPFALPFRARHALKKPDDGRPTLPVGFRIFRVKMADSSFAPFWVKTADGTFKQLIVKV